MRIALIGYGKMGKAIDELSGDHEIITRIASADHSDWQKLSNADVAIEFTEASMVKANIEKCFASNIPVVSGTTGWLSEGFDELKKIAESGKGGFFYASNFSIGVNLFFDLNRKLAKLMNDRSEYQISMSETHHTEKKDAPSGTAITLAEGIIDELDRKDGWKLDEGSKEKIGITAKRIEGVPGTHEVEYRSNIDRITISHEAFSRKGFALGAISAAEFMVGKTGFYTMQDLLNI